MQSFRKSELPNVRPLLLKQALLCPAIFSLVEDFNTGNPIQRGQGATEVAMGEERDTSIQNAETGNEPISAVGNLSRNRFQSGRPGKFGTCLNTNRRKVIAHSRARRVALTGSVEDLTARFD